MKKFYSLLAVVALTATLNAQAYSTGFESTDGFVAGNVYNNTDVAFSGATGKQWGTFFGTPSTTSALTGNQSMQMRWYTSSATSRAYTYTNFNSTGISTVTFNAANTNGINVIVSYSTDGGTTWVNPQTFVLTTSSTGYTYSIPTSETGTSFRFKFELTYATAPTATSRLYLDDVKFNVPTMAVVDATKGKANLVKNTIVSNELIFGASAKVSVVNMNGQVVKTAEVSENSRLDVSNLVKGTYVVTAVVNGQTVSQKIIKK
ncbi:T9SS type A sorting domain-containing protein [Chryseobacterium sp. FH1]|uniref:T9SS type A sorting domain-containing protein n=1 Tax=Chryseobacterium sp. FH1 TaxID=1233951 RepID=UPI00068DA36A|nr:T9SS type A sorting domain-containing protein [Chryseobacterium sp. FH1]